MSYQYHNLTSIPGVPPWGRSLGHRAPEEVGGMYLYLICNNRLVGLVVRRPPREREIPGSNPACDGIFSGSSHISDLKIGTPVATLPGA